MALHGNKGNHHHHHNDYPCSVEWYEPRLNITSEFWGAENTTDDELIPGKNYDDDYDDDDVDGGRRFLGN